MGAGRGRPQGSKVPGAPHHTRPYAKASSARIEGTLCSISPETNSVIEICGENLGELIQKRLPPGLVEITQILAAEPLMRQDDLGSGTTLDKFDRNHCFLTVRCSK